MDDERPRGAPVLLRRRADDGLEVLQVDGSVDERDVDRLTEALDEVLRREPLGVVIDLSRVEGMTPTAVEALQQSTDEAGRWSGAALAVCTPAESQSSPVLRAVLEHSPRSPAQARAVVRLWSAHLGLGQVRDDLLLVVTELVTNAVRYARPPLQLQVEVNTSSVTVVVADGTPEPATPRDPDADAENGRGLLIVDLLAVERGVRPAPPGKAVWAALARSGL